MVKSSVSTIRKNYHKLTQSLICVFFQHHAATLSNRPTIRLFLYCLTLFTIVRGLDSVKKHNT